VRAQRLSFAGGCGFEFPVRYLFNLGMVYSDLGAFGRAIALLEKCVKLAPPFTNARVALGVALTRNNQNEGAVEELLVAIYQEPDNPYARRNLGGALVKLEKYQDALPHLRLAAEINPEDQSAWYGLGLALERTGDIDGANEAYRTGLDVDEFGPMAELIRTARSRIGEHTFRAATPQAECMDAVKYCLGALERFEDMSLADVQKIGFEIAILGTRGINVNNPGSRYTLRSLPGSFSGLQLLCLEYVAFKKFAPEHDIGFDLSAEYRSAQALFERKKSLGE
jgi:tetratricopeptide (TPR) repeat protein